MEGLPGCDAVVIPHNSNLSAGLMFETAYVGDEAEGGQAGDRRTEAARRARWNTLFEVMQHKGSSECDSRLPIWADEDLCGFEKMGYDRFGGKNTGDLQFAKFGRVYAKVLFGMETPRNRTAWRGKLPALRPEAGPCSSRRSWAPTASSSA